MSDWLQVGATVAAAVAAGSAWKTAQETKRLANDNVKQSEALRTPFLIVSMDLNHVQILNGSLHTIFIYSIRVIPEGPPNPKIKCPAIFDLSTVRTRNPNSRQEADAIVRARLQPGEEKEYYGEWSSLIVPGSNESTLWTLRITFNYPLHPQGPLSWDVPFKVSRVKSKGGVSLLIQTERATVGDPDKLPEVRYKEL